jgi:leucyl aminopeptidase (aminopeptidase T)
MLNLSKLFIDVFDPQPGEVAAVLVDQPHGSLRATPEWEERRAMAQRWRVALSQLGEERGFDVLPLVEFAATGMNNAQLPATATQEAAPILFHELASEVTLLLALTEFSASAPLIEWTKQFPQLRVASMPRVAPAMEGTALAADYSQVARSCARLRGCLKEADFADIEFSTGDKLRFDFRFREAEVDDGRLPRDAPPPRLINLPSGEAYTAAYEGEQAQASQTRGVLPVPWRGEIVRLRVEGNRVQEVLGKTSAGENLRTFLFADPARCNIAELGLGCNPMARVWGNVLEDEKAGPHIALGRSEHLGGTVGPTAFKDPRNVWHEDFVYARDCPIQIRRLALVNSSGDENLIYANGSYAAELEVGI